MTLDEQPVLIAVSITKDKAAPMPTWPEIPRVYELRCQSSLQNGNFRFETGQLIGEARRKCDLLKQHGFTVLACSPYKARLASNDFQSRHEIIRDALERIAQLYEGRNNILTGYDEKFANTVLQVLSAKFPSKMQVLEIKHALSTEPSDQELMTALDALFLEGYVQGVPLKSYIAGSNQLVAMANIVITKEGRDHLKISVASGDTPAMSNMHFYGPVGSVGHNSTGSVNVSQQWISSDAEPDWIALAQAFGDALAVKAKLAATSEDFSQVAQLAKAREEAESKNRQGFLDVVTKIGESALPVLASAGAHGIIAFLEQHMGWKLK